MTRLILTRHGHVEGIDPPRFRGRQELPLTAIGRAQILALARRIAAIANPAVVFTSPMQRCVDTARAVAEACGIAVEILPDLNDLDYGTWQWRTYDEMRAREPAMFATWMAAPHLVRFPSGESLQDIVARSADALRVVLERYPRDGDCVVMVGHDTINRALLLQLLDQPLSAYWRLRQAPCCLNELELRDGRVWALGINERQHLAGAGE